MSDPSSKTTITFGPGWAEATITVNGHALTFGQSMTVRVALENMARELVNEGLGDDAHGSRMTQAYLGRIREIREMTP